MNYIADASDGAIRHPVYGDPGERIWHPDGPPTLPNPNAEAIPVLYEGETKAALEAAYAYVRETGAFQHGVVPELPPKKEWIRWDL